MKASDLFTRPTANAGRRFDIPAPDGGVTGEWVVILHTDSDAFRRKQAEALSTAASLTPDVPQDERRRLRDRVRLELTASLVSGWSLEDECNERNVLELLENAPYLADWIDRQADKAALFFGKGSTSSSSTAEPKQPLSAHLEDQTENREQGDSATT